MGVREHPNIWDRLFISATIEVSNFGLGSSSPTNDLYDQNWRGSGLGEYPKKFGTTDLFIY